jgi:hypothetical protein
MRYQVLVSYSARSRYYVGGANAEQAEEVARVCHEAAYVGEWQEITSLQTTPSIAHAPVTPLDADSEDALLLAEEIQLCPDCGQNLPYSGPNEELRRSGRVRSHQRKRSNLL